jgi:hypothetical protein
MAWCAVKTHGQLYLYVYLLLLVQTPLHKKITLKSVLGNETYRFTDGNTDGQT